MWAALSVASKAATMAETLDDMMAGPKAAVLVSLSVAQKAARRAAKSVS